ncbi:PilW family protein [Herbaspirillum sp. RTI4]|uniref:PilW family protein n=1 Tax=Herbaspirillum sp. RTI4 TaxID=3048640 RepID=UPI002AB34451|nr:PilW family protein [Herbaspirillum sp. RTI4]MDY7579803.1 PilW family protein [Herbaspirillum sp. RTI4]MEA9982592.1 PilW family protein [Herbaspirillum sp. RTI4]
MLLPRPAAQSGLTLIELMVAMALGLLVTLAASALLLASKTNYLHVDDSARINDNGHYALEIIARSIRQAGYFPWDSNAPLPHGLPNAIAGIDNQTLQANSSDWQAAKTTPALNGSDVLATFFSGSGQAGAADGGIVNCAGVAVAPPNSGSAKPDGSVFYVSTDASGEPELQCKYRGAHSNDWSAAAIVRGVESFQVLYGIDTDADGMPNQFLPASKISTQAQWRKVVAVQVGLLIRGTHDTGAPASDIVYHLLGADYSQAAQGGRDLGVRLALADLAKPLRSRQRKLFQQTIWLRNPA